VRKADNRSGRRVLRGVKRVLVGMTASGAKLPFTGMSVLGWNGRRFSGPSSPLMTRTGRGEVSQYNSIATSLSAIRHRLSYAFSTIRKAGGIWPKSSRAKRVPCIGSTCVSWTTSNERENPTISGLRTNASRLPDSWDRRHRLQHKSYEIDLPTCAGSIECRSQVPACSLETDAERRGCISERSALRKQARQSRLAS
jgi:hypothetical protein